jgi:hypothetical protein
MSSRSPRIGIDHPTVVPDPAPAAEEESSGDGRADG